MSPPADSFGFLHPERWPWLLVLPLLGLLLLLGGRRLRRELRAFAAGEALRELWPRGGARAGWRNLAIGMGLLSLGLALLEPTYGQRLLPVRHRGSDLVVCFDVSRSMQARDLSPSRDGRARRDLAALLEALEGDRIALVAFAGDARVVCPLTRDYAAFEALLEQTDLTSTRLGGTNLGAALDTALALLPAEGADSQAILVLSDGEDLEGKGRSEAARARRRGIVLHCVGYGSPAGAQIPDGNGGWILDEKGKPVVSKMDAQGLRRLAESSGGVYVAAENLPLPLVEIYEKRIRSMAKRLQAKEERRRPVPRSGWFLGGSFCLLFLAFLFGGRRRFPLALCLPVLLPLQGRDFGKGVSLLRKGKYAAAQRALTKAWKAYGDEAAPAELAADLAIAAFRVGKFDEARAFAEKAAARDPGFAYLRDLLDGAASMAEAAAVLPKDPAKARERAERAVGSFEGALGTRPEAPEARRNLERALDLLRRIEESLKRKKKDEKDPSSSKNRKKGSKKEQGKDPKKTSDPSKQKDEERKERDEGGETPQENPPKEGRESSRAGKDPKDDSKREKRDRPPRRESKNTAPPDRGEKKEGGRSEGGASKNGRRAGRPMRLSPEEAKRLRNRLEKLLELAKQRRKMRAPRHRPGKKDW